MYYIYVFEDLTIKTGTTKPLEGDLTAANEGILRLVRINPSANEVVEYFDNEWHPVEPNA